MTQSYTYGAPPYQSNGNDFEVNGKQYPGYIMNPVLSEPGGLYSVLREIAGSQWLIQNAEVSAAGFFLQDATQPAYAFTLLAAGGLAMYYAPAGSAPGFAWTRLFWVDATGVLQTPTSDDVAGTFNVKTFGATGNGTTDDTNAVQNAFNAAIAAGGGTVVFPAGTYLTSANLLITNGTGLILQGSGTSSIVSALSDIDVIRVTGGGPSFVVQDLFLTSSSVATFNVAGAAVHFTSSFNSGGLFFNRLKTTNVGYGLKLDVPGGGRNCVFQSNIKANLMGIYTQHDIHVLESDVNGGTYGLVADNTQEGCQVHNSRLFGVCSFLATNTTGNPNQGNSIKMVNCEANYGPPPQAGGGTPSVATGSFTLSGTPTTGDTYSLVIGLGGAMHPNPVTIPVAETTGQTLAQSAIQAAAAINASAIGPAGSNPLVQATPSGGVIGIAALEAGSDGNLVTLGVVNGADVTVVASGGHLLGGADSGIWPGDPGDPFSSLPNAAILSTCDYNFAFAPHQLHLVNSWGASLIIGNVAAAVGPSAFTIAGGSFNASTKGKNRGTFYAIDVQQLSTAGGKGTFTMSGGVAQALAGVALNGIIHLGQGTVNATLTGVQMNNQHNANPALVIDDATGSCDISVENCPMIGTSPGQSPVQFYAALGTAVLPTVVVRNCPGFNPTSYTGNIALPGTGVAFANQFGIDGQLSVSGGTVTAIEYLNVVAGTYTSIPFTGGFAPFPAQATVKLIYTGTPVITFLGN